MQSQLSSSTTPLPRNRFEWVEASSLELERAFSTNCKTGLTSQQVDVNGALHGSNSLCKVPLISTWRIVASQFANPMVAFLGVGFVVTLCCKEWAAAGAMGILVCLNCTSGAWLEVSAARALEALAELSSPRCTVVRDEVRLTIESRNLVVGDVVIISTGDTISADMRIIEADDLQVNEALLTGESQSVVKVAGPIAKCADNFPRNIIYTSTHCVNGQGKAIVIAVGLQTEIGLIAQCLAEDAQKGTKRTPLEQALHRLERMIGIGVTAMLVLIFTVAAVVGYEDPINPDRNRWVSIVILAVGFAVAALPAALPAVVTASFAIGSTMLARVNAQVRRLPAVETLGCTSVICSDKTGTLTQAEMTMSRMAVFMAREKRGGIYEFNDLMLKFEPAEGFVPDGGLFVEGSQAGDLFTMKRSGGGEDEDRHLSLADYSKAILFLARLACSRTELQYSDVSQRWLVAGNSTEGAVVVAAAKAGWRDAEFDWRAFAIRDDHLSLAFTSARKYGVSVYRIDDALESMPPLLRDFFHKSFTNFAIVQGAPEIIQTFSIRLPVVAKGRIVAWRRMEEVELIRLQQANLRMSTQALRVLLLALIPLDENDMEVLRGFKEASQRDHYFMFSCETILLSLFGSMDPPKPGVRKAIQECQAAGVRVIIITGDQTTTTMALAQSVGLGRGLDHGAVNCAEEFADLRDGIVADRDKQSRVDRITSRKSIFCRAKPEDKLLIVNSLQRQEEVVAMTGDGVNDAPALRSADIGVAMGLKGTDVAKSAADLVLTDDNFATIVTAIREGRRIFINVQRFVSFLIGTVFGETWYLTICIIGGIKLPINAVQVLFIGLVCDALPAIALAREPADEDAMKRKPRDGKSRVLTREFWLYLILPNAISICTLIVAFTLFATWTATGVFISSQISRQCQSFEGKKYYCQTSEYVMGHGFVTHIDFFFDHHLRQYLGVIKGNFANRRLTPWDLNIPIGDCIDRDAYGWCLPPKKWPGASKNYSYVTVRAGRIIGAQTFIAASLAEVMWPYSLRSWEPLWSVLNRSGWLHIAAWLPFLLTILVANLPGIRIVMGCALLPPWRLAISIILPAFHLLLQELIPKSFYRYNRRKAYWKLPERHG